jgi:hypothetical protein
MSKSLGKRIASITQVEKDLESGGKGEFQTRFRMLDKGDAKLLFVREGTYRPGPYQMPKDHDFRGVSINPL